MVLALHIARTVHLFYPEAVGDPFCSHELSLQQVARGHKVTVLTWARFKRRIMNESVDRLQVIRLKGLNFGLDGIVTEYPFFPGLASAIKSIKPDLIDAQSHLFLTTYCAVAEAKKLGLPSIVTVHGVFAKRNVFLNLIQQAYLRTLSASIFGNATRIICLTKSDASEIIRVGAQESKIRIVPNAVDLVLYKPRQEKSTDPMFAWVGRFVPEKGLTCLVEAMRIVIAECRNCRFTLIGDGPMLPLIKEMVKTRDLSSRVLFTGSLESISVSRLLSEATGFVFPSLKEGMPRAVLEAMACGLPIIASNISGLNELVRNGYNGLLVPPGDARALAKATLTIVNDADLAKNLGMNARRTVERNHDWKKVLDALESVYEEACAEI